MTRYDPKRGNDTVVASPKALTILEQRGAADKFLVDADLSTVAELPDDSVQPGAFRTPGTRPDHIPGLPPLLDPAAGTDATTDSATRLSSPSQTLAAATVIHGDLDDNELGSPDATAPEVIYGGEGWDTLWGGAAADELHGEVDNDLLIGGAGNDTLDGGADFDTVSYWQESGGGGVVVNLSDAAWTYGTATYQSLTGTDTWGSLDTLIGIEALTGSGQADVIYAKNSAAAWYLDGDAGNDTLTGGGNDDTLIGGAGNDTLINGTVVYLGLDAINANLMTGTVTGQGNDTLSQVSRLIGSEGNDTIYGGNFASTIDGSFGNDVLYVGGSTTVLATMGNDTVHGGMSTQASTNRITGTASTTLTYEDLGPTFAVYANLASNWVDEYNGGVRLASDTLFSPGIRSFIGSNGNDTILGSSHGSTLVGGGGNDYINAGGGGDSLVGGDGNDTLEGSYGYVDTLVGGLGDDYYMISVDTMDVLVDAGGNDTIEVMRSSYTLGAGFENLVSKETSGAILTGNSSDNKLTSSYGNDTLDGAGGNDTMTGGDGDDTYYIRDLGDIAIELNTKYSGNDTVIISVRNYDGTKLANIENIRFVGDGSILGSNTAPVIGGISSPMNLDVDDNKVVNPFSSITITDTDSAMVTAIVTMDHNYGALTNLGIGSYDAQLWRYTVTGTAEQVQNALRNLVYDPTDRPLDAVGSSQTTHFTVSVTDAEGAGATPNSNVSVTATTINRAPTLAVVHQTFSMADTENTDLVTPFTGVAFNDQNAGDILTVRITLDAASKGALIPTNGGTYDAGTGVFTIIGSAQQAMAAIMALRFNPTDRPTAPGGEVETTTFSISVTDASGGTVSQDSIATVNSVATGFVNHAPTAPVLSGGSITDRASAGQLVGTLSAMDQDGDPLAITFDSAQPYSSGLISADGRFKIVNGTIVVNNPLYIQVDGDQTFTYTVTATDGHGGTTSGSVTIDVADANHAPSAPVLLGNSTVSEAVAARTVVGTLSSTDTDNDPLNYTFINAMAGTNGWVSADGRFEIVNGTVQVRDPSLIQVNQDTTFTYGVYVSDGYSVKVPGAMSITVTNVNKAPVDLILSNTTVREHTAVGQTIAIVNANDPDQNGLTYTLLDDGGGRVELVNNELRVKNNAKIDFEQLTSFKITVAASDGTATVTKAFTLSITDVNPENVTGTAAADLIRGGIGHDTLSGAGGNDTLSGGAGDDRLTGGLGSDVFLFDTAPAKAGADTILDFNTRDNDRIYLSRTAFTGFGAFDIGALQTKAFVLGTVAKDADDRIMYDQTTGKVYYDADGIGTGSAVLIATLATKPVLTSSAFFVI